MGTPGADSTGRGGVAQARGPSSVMLEIAQVVPDFSADELSDLSNSRKMVLRVYVVVRALATTES